MEQNVLDHSVLLGGVTVERRAVTGLHAGPKDTSSRRRPSARGASEARLC